MSSYFADIAWLYALIVVPFGMAYSIWRVRGGGGHYRVSKVAKKGYAFLGTIKIAVQLLPWFAVALLVIALARPQTSELIQQNKQNLGIDLVMAVDISPSMLARDLKPSRLEALKAVAQEFVDSRAGDRLGLTIYAGEAYSPIPLTTDHALLKNQIASLEYDMLEGGTAIGMGLAAAANRLSESSAKSKVIILLTDGENNSGLIDPIQAAELAKGLGIKVYTIGVGTKGHAETPVQIDPRTGKLYYAMAPVNIDEDLMTRIAQLTGGRYFRATDNQQLSEIYSIIDGLEKSEIEGYQFEQHTEHFFPFVLSALCLLGLFITLESTLLKSAF